MDAPRRLRALGVVGGIPVRVGLAAADGAPDLVDVSVEFSRTGLERRFRLARNEMPPEELGDEGITGLNYVPTPGASIDVQFVCEASPPSRAPIPAR
jgi:hypothetical protein